MRWLEFWNRSSGRLLAALSAGAVVIGAMLCSCRMNELTRVSSQSFPEPQSCAHCHVDIYNEWQSSPHARAFTNPRFAAATDDHRFGQCLGCHTPQPAMVTAEPRPRAAACELGVTCVSCHLSHGAMVGPLTPTGMVRPHPITVDPTPFENGRLCGQCHQGTLAQWKAATHETGGDCRQCHMPSIVRKTTQATSEVSKIFVAAEKNVPEHRHLFTLTPEDLPEPAMTLDLQPAASCATLTLTNHLPHNLPTGDFGVRLIEISTDGIDAKGNVTPLAHWELTNAGGGSLGAGQSREWSVALPTSVRKLRSTVVRQGRDGANRVLLLTREAPVP